MELFRVSKERYSATLQNTYLQHFAKEVPFKFHRARPPQADSGFLQVVVIENGSAISFCSYAVDLCAEPFPMNANNYSTK
jgi:hypothetical protein